jgi:hypothetical protein
MLKKPILTIILAIVFNTTAKCQFEYNGIFYFTQSENSEPDAPLEHKGINTEFLEQNYPLESPQITKDRKELSISSSSSIKKNSKGKVMSESHQIFNKNGYLTEYQTPRLSYHFNYQNDTLIMEIQQASKKSSSKTVFTYSINKTIVRKQNNKGETIKLITTQKNEKGQVTSKKTEYGKKQTKSFEYKSFYNQEGKLEKSQSFEDDKLVREWTYNCDDKGKIVKKDDNVKEQSSCKWKEERNDGSYINYYRTIYESGTKLIVSEFSKDSVMISNEEFLDDLILIRSMKRIGDTKIDKNFSEKGKLKSTSVVVVNDQNHLIFSERIYYRLHTHIVTNRNSYTSNGILSSSEQFSNGKMQWKKNYEHNVQNQITKMNFIAKKNTYSKEYTYDLKDQLASILRERNGKCTSKIEIQNTYLE